jgi:ATP-binding cassette subfamily B protein
MKTWPFNWRLIRQAPVVFTIHSLFQLLLYAAPIALGLIAKAVFDTISGAAPVGVNVWSLVGLYVAVGLGQLGLSFVDVWGSTTFRYTVGSVVRRNMFAGLLRRPGALPLPVPPGEALSRYRNDVNEVADFPLWLPDVAGNLLVFGLATMIMAAINPTITLVIFLPLVLLVFVGRAGWARLLRAYEDSAQATDRVSGFLGELLGAVQAVKVAGAETHTVAHLTALNAERGRLKVRERMLHEVIYSLADYSSALGVGIVLLLVGQGLSGGTFSVGDFVLFLTYMQHTTHLPAYLGTFLGDYRQQQAAIRRLLELVPDEPAEVLFRAGGHRATCDGNKGTSGQADREKPVTSSSAPLLSVAGLTYLHPGSGQGVREVSLELPRGSLTVVTGKIGSGKTTLLRAILGLLPPQAGVILWQGVFVPDPAAHFRPPVAAYTPQVARLFSASLRENILLGQPANAATLQAAIRTAVLEPDLATMPDGLATLVGPRGVRLSGGQVQRVAAARMLVRNSELIVCDDLSSALDVDTEAQLWAGLRGGPNPPTILAVSHRQPLLQQADHVIVLDNGRIVAEGHWEELVT